MDVAGCIEPGIPIAQVKPIQEDGAFVQAQAGIHLADESAWLQEWIRHPLGIVLLAVGGLLATTVTLHLVCSLGRLHGAFAKRMLVAL